MNYLQMIHFELPYWLILIPATWIIFALIHYQNSSSSILKQTIDKNLLVHLEQEGTPSHLNKWLGIVCVTLLLVGLAGISWIKEPSTMFESTSKTVFIIDQSLSMYATDIVPNRQTLLKQTIQDILKQSKDGNIALVAFAGDAHTISPFTQDKDTVINFLLALEPIIMPEYGSNLTSGIKKGLSLITSRTTPVHFVILTDNINAKDQKTIPSLLAKYNIHTNLITIGTKKGGHIQLPSKQILELNKVNTIPNVPIDQLKSFAKKIHANFYNGRLTQSQLDAITQKPNSQVKTQQANNRSIHWLNQGHWFALPFLLWLTFQFRRGVLFILLIGIFILPSNKVTASSIDWFKTQNQLGQKAVNDNNWKQANKYFTRPDWKAASEYALGKYSQAAKILTEFSKSANDYYNLGNAQALSGRTQDAINAYKKALILNQSMKQAKENLSYLEKKQKKNRSPKTKNKQSGQEYNSNNHKQKKDQDNNQKSQDSTSSHSRDNPKNRSNPKKDNKKNEKQNKKPSPKDNRQEQKQTTQPELSREQKQTLKRWLRQIQNNPGTLLQRKLWYLHQEKHQERQIKQEDELNPW